MEARSLLTTLPPGFVETPVVPTGLWAPTSMAFAPDGRLFVTQQTGEVLVVKDGRLLPTPFLKLTTDFHSERGLLGLAFDPQFEQDGFVYVYYTVPGEPAHNRVSRFTADGDVARPGSEVPILDLPPLQTQQHNGGALHFGVDGTLYVAVGNDLHDDNSQSYNTPFGKLLRINPDGSIPADNPFVAITTGVNQAIWAIGLRNPFTFAVQPTTGRIFINDVGEDAWEEVDEGSPGANYGWPQTEGPTAEPGIVGPLFAYNHGVDDANGCAITGGTFYNPSVSQFPADMVGSYFFADWCGNWIHRLDPATGQVSDFAADLPPRPVDLAVGPDGGLYYLAQDSFAAGAVYEIRNPSAQPPAVAPPSGQTAALGQPATFSIAVSGTAPLTIQWMKNGVPIPGANAPTYTIPSVGVGDLGASYSAMATNSFGAALSQPAALNGDSPYIRALFFDVLHAAPDPASLTAGTIALASGVSPSAIAAYFLLTPQARGQAVAQAYLRILGRAPSPQELSQGMSSLYVTRTPDDLAAALYASPEYSARNGGNGAGFVAALYRDVLGRSPSRSELSAARRNLGASARANLARRLLASNEAHAVEVAGWYLAYLRRAPLPAEATAWSRGLRAGMSPLTVQAAILGGPEYVADSPIIVASASKLGIRRQSRS